MSDPRHSTDETQDLKRHIEQLHWLQAEAAKPDGLRRLVRGVARSIEGNAVLFDADGRSKYAFPDVGDELFDVVGSDVERVRTGRAGSAAVDTGTRTVSVLPVGPEAPFPVLVVARQQPLSARDRTLLGDATRLLWLCRQVETTREAQRRVDRTDSRIRESVLQLLMLGNRGAAKRVAATLGPRLSEAVRVLVAEVAPVERGSFTIQCNAVSDGRAWVVPCPVYNGHVIVLAPVDGPVRQGGGALTPEPIIDRFREITTNRDDVCVGASSVVSLRETSVGYEQAFHALADVRNSVERYAEFDRREDLAEVLAPAGNRWRTRVLAPLLDFRPSRSQDPDAEELMDTLVSWLTFYGRAVKQLRIHRNTLSARLARIEHVLDADLRDIGTQARLHLALRLPDRSSSPSGDAERDLDELVDGPEVRSWARRQLSSLLETDARSHLTTLRAWLAHDAHLDATAASLGVSVPGTRKRLLRMEGVLERSLLHGPSARYDLYFALRVHEGHGLGLT